MNTVAKALLSVVTGLLVSIIGGMVGYLYRDSFEASRLTIEYARIDAPQQPIALADDTRRVLKVDGNVMDFVEERVQWKVRPVVEKNDYTYQQIGEMQELLPKVNEDFSGTGKELSASLGTMEKALIRVRQLTDKKRKDVISSRDAAITVLKEFPELSRRLAATRNYYRSTWNLDIFELIYQNPDTALGKLIFDLQGDVAQVAETLQTISTVTSEVQNKWKAGPPGFLPVIGGDVPEVIITVIVSNTGRTDALLRNTGAIKIDNHMVKLIRFDRAAERRRRSYQFDKVPAGGTLELDLAFDTDANPPGDEQKIYTEIVKGVKALTLTLIDIGGRPVRATILQ
jgi:hypothetical protein